MSLKKHKLVQTKDGSYSLYSEDFDECTHSAHGAREETILHYIKGCKIVQAVKEFNPFNILEVGFGSGLGVTESYQALKNTNSEINFISLEIQDELINYFNSEQNTFKLKEISKNLYFDQVDNFKLSVYIGNARKTIHQIKHELHAIYQDAYSPRKNPELWTKEWFKSLYELSHSQVIMSTYSSSSSIRKAMIEAGFKVHQGDKFGPKKSSTRASKAGETDIEIKEQLSRSPAVILEDELIEKYKNKEI